jgi:hypothetical protein
MVFESAFLEPSANQPLQTQFKMVPKALKCSHSIRPLPHICFNFHNKHQNMATIAQLPRDPQQEHLEQSNPL